MTVERITIENIRGIKSIILEPKTVTRIQGKNNTGKSSIIASIRSVFSGGHDPTLIRIGAKQGHAHILLSNGWTFDKIIKLKESILTVKDENGDTVPAPQETVNRIASAMAVDPSKILSLDTTACKGKREFCELLLSLMPIIFSEPEIGQALGDCGLKPPAGKRDLEYIDAVRKTIYERRTRANVAVQEADKAADAIKRMLPPDAGQAVDIQAIDEELWQDREHLTDKLNKRLATISASYEAKIDALRAEREAERETVTRDVAPQIAKIDADRADLQEREKRAAVATESKRMYDTLCQRSKDEAEQADRTRAAIDRIDSLRKSRLESLPIEGMDFTDNNPTLDGVPWQAVNTARRCEVAIQLAAMMASSDLAFMVLDDAEHLDDETRAGIEQAAASAGFQLLSAMVDSDEPTLKIVSVEAANVPA